MIPHTCRRLSSDPCRLQTCKSSCVHHLHPPSSGCKHRWGWPEGCELVTSILTPPWIDKGQMIPSTGIDAVGHQPLRSLFTPLHLFDCLCGLKRQRVMSLLIKSFLGFVFFLTAFQEFMEFSGGRWALTKAGTIQLQPPLPMSHSALVCGCLSPPLTILRSSSRSLFLTPTIMLYRWMHTRMWQTARLWLTQSSDWKKGCSLTSFSPRQKSGVF